MRSRDDSESRQSLVEFEDTRKGTRFIRLSRRINHPSAFTRHPTARPNRTRKGMHVPLPLVEYYVPCINLLGCHLRVTVGDSGLCCCVCNSSGICCGWTVQIVLYLLWLARSGCIVSDVAGQFRLSCICCGWTVQVVRVVQEYLLWLDSSGCTSCTVSDVAGQFKL